jgi:hypothetical protein
MRAPTAFAILALGLLAGCGPQGKAITADQLPHVKPGLWLEVVTENGVAMGASQDCSDGALHFPGALMPAGCSSQPVMLVTPNGAVVIDWRCAAGGASTTVHTTAAGDFNSAYLIDSKTTMSASGAAPLVTTLHEAFKLTGACPAGPDSAAASESD